MYRRYSQANGDGISLSQIKKNRIKDIVILLLVAALAALAVIAVPALQNRSSMRELFVQRIQSECDEAIRQTATLSRNAGADSAMILARIRSNLYAIKVLNMTYHGATGEWLVQDEDIQTLLNMVNNYMDYLKKGMETGEYQTNLQTALDQLQGILANLE